MFVNIFANGNKNKFDEPLGEAIRKFRVYSNGFLLHYYYLKIDNCNFSFFFLLKSKYAQPFFWIIYWTVFCICRVFASRLAFVIFLMFVFERGADISENKRRNRFRKYKKSKNIYYGPKKTAAFLFLIFVHKMKKNNFGKKILSRDLHKKIKVDQQPQIFDRLKFIYRNSIVLLVLTLFR